LKTFDPHDLLKTKVTNLRLFVGIIFLLLGFLSGTLVGFALLKRRTLVSIAVATLLTGYGYIIRSEWKNWREWVSLYPILGSFLVGLSIALAIFAVTREE